MARAPWSNHPAERAARRSPHADAAGREAGRLARRLLERPRLPSQQPGFGAAFLVGVWPRSLYRPQFPAAGSEAEVALELRLLPRPLEVVVHSARARTHRPREPPAIRSLAPPMPIHRTALVVTVVAAASLATGCGTDTPPQERGSPVNLTHDYGTIQHGKAGEHDFVLDMRKDLGADYYLLGTHIDCSCARALPFFRDAAGHERAITAYGPDAVPAPGEVLVIRLQVDTARKEPVDVGPVDSHALVQFQHKDARDGNSRQQWFLMFHYAIDAPVRVHPFAVLDFERVPQSRPGTLVTTLASDLPNRPIRFGPAHCADPRVHLELEPRGELTFLRATLQPRGGDDGFVRTLVTVDTDLEAGYQIQLAAIAQIVPDLSAMPLPKLSLRADLRRPQPPERAQSQYLLVTDHDRSRPAEFAVARVVDATGNDASADFEITFEAVAGEDRSRRMRVRWIGHRETEFRGEIALAKDPQRGPFLAIELVALHSPQP